MAPWASRSVSVPPTLPDTGMEIYLAARPAGMLSPSTDFGVRWSPVPSVADLLPGTALVRVLYVSADPAMRGWMSAARSYIRPVEVGAKMRAAGVGEVVGSAAGLRVGELVYVT
jgi:NADPH-dependent curcumin reductase